MTKPNYVTNTTKISKPWCTMGKELKLLIEMYSTHSPSFGEEKMMAIVMRELNKMNIQYNIDEKMNIYSFEKTKPLICAHMDQVGTKQIQCIFVEGDIIHGTHNLGADDKNGVWICLQLLKKFKGKISFLFSTGEENGGNIETLLKKKTKTLQKIPYGLVFDRKGSTDIIGGQNNYCTATFDEDLAKIASFAKTGHKAALGTMSDCDKIKKYMSCVNISCGYHNAHSDNEYSSKEEILNCYEFGNAILENITKRYEIPVAPRWVYPSSIYSNIPHGKRDTYWDQHSRKSIHSALRQDQAVKVSSTPKEEMTPETPKIPKIPKKKERQPTIQNKFNRICAPSDCKYCPYCYDDCNLVQASNGQVRCMNCNSLMTVDKILTAEDFTNI